MSEEIIRLAKGEQQAARYSTRSAEKCTFFVALLNVVSSLPVVRINISAHGYASQTHSFKFVLNSSTTRYLSIKFSHFPHQIAFADTKVVFQVGLYGNLDRIWATPFHLPPHPRLYEGGNSFHPSSSPLIWEGGQLPSTPLHPRPFLNNKTTSVNYFSTD